MRQSAQIAAISLVFAFVLASGGARQASSGGEADAGTRVAISSALDALHDAASKADGDRYFALFGPEAVFLGTDASERWPLDEFKTYANKRFATGAGWTYTLRPGTRHIEIEGGVAWFDELLENAKYGTCRGSGVLRKIDGQWKIVHYNLTFTVPNEVAAEVVAVIRRHESSP